MRPGFLAGGGVGAGICDGCEDCPCIAPLLECAPQKDLRCDQANENPGKLTEKDPSCGWLIGDVDVDRGPETEQEGEKAGNNKADGSPSLRIRNK